MNIYETVVKYCSDNSISIFEFEKKCKIGNGTVGKWKKGISEPSIKTLQKIQNGTGIKLSFWIGGIL